MRPNRRQCPVTFGWTQLASNICSTQECQYSTRMSSKSVLWSTFTKSVSQVLISSSVLVGLSSAFFSASTWYLQYSITFASILLETFGNGIGASRPVSEKQTLVSVLKPCSHFTACRKRTFTHVLHCQGLERNVLFYLKHLLVRTAQFDLRKHTGSIQSSHGRDGQSRAAPCQPLGLLRDWHRGKSVATLATGV